MNGFSIYQVRNVARFQQFYLTSGFSCTNDSRVPFVLIIFTTCNVLHSILKMYIKVDNNTKQKHDAAVSLHSDNFYEKVAAVETISCFTILQKPPLN